MKHRRSHPAAWTLVELLVAIGIIGILASLALPAWSGIRANADQAQCASRLRNLSLAGLSWINDHGGAMPDAMYWRFPSENHDGSILPYLGYRDTMLNQKGATVVSCPASFRAVGPNADWNRSYSINIYACGTENGQRYSPFDRGVARVQQVASPARMAFFMDGNFLTGGAPERKVGPASVENVWDKQQKTGFYDQHTGMRANVVFLDGHLEPISRTNLPKGNPTEQRLNQFWGAIQ